MSLAQFHREWQHPAFAPGRILNRASRRELHSLFSLRHYLSPFRQEPEFFAEALERINAAKGNPDLFQQPVEDSVISKFEKKLVDTQVSV